MGSGRGPWRNGGPMMHRPAGSAASAPPLIPQDLAVSAQGGSAVSAAEKAANSQAAVGAQVRKPSPILEATDAWSCS